MLDITSLITWAVESAILVAGGFFALKAQVKVILDNLQEIKDELKGLKEKLSDTSEKVAILDYRVTNLEKITESLSEELN